LIHEHAFKSICDLPEFEPRTYQRLLKRVKGIALAQETGKSAKLFACRKLPKNFKSWIAYRDFLMKTHPDRERLPIFQKRFARHLENEYVARQQCRQLLLNDYENNLPIDNIEDPREALVRYYDEVLLWPLSTSTPRSSSSRRGSDWVPCTSPPRRTGRCPCLAATRSWSRRP